MDEPTYDILFTLSSVAHTGIFAGMYCINTNFFTIKILRRFLTRQKKTVYVSLRVANLQLGDIKEREKFAIATIKL